METMKQNMKSINYSARFHVSVCMCVFLCLIILFPVDTVYFAGTLESPISLLPCQTEETTWSQTTWLTHQKGLAMIFNLKELSLSTAPTLL